MTTAIKGTATWFGQGAPKQHLPVEKEAFASLIKQIFDPQNSNAPALAKNHSVTDDNLSTSSDESAALIAKSKKASRPLHAGPAADLLYVEGDLVGFVRKPLGLLAQVNQKKFPFAKQANGTSTALAAYLFTGAEATLSGHGSAKKAYNIGDKSTFAANVVKTMRGGFEMMSGGSAAVTSGMAALASPQQLSSMQKILTNVAIGSSAATGMLYIGLAAPAAISLKNTVSFLTSLNNEIKVGGDKQGFIHLQNAMKMQNTDRKKVLDEIFYKKEQNPLTAAFSRFINWIYADAKSKQAKKDLETLRSLVTKESLASKDMKDLLHKVDPENNFGKMLSDADKTCAEEYIAEHFSDLGAEQKQNLLRLISVFYKLGLNVTKERKETTLKKQVGEKVFETVQAHLNSNVHAMDEKLVTDTVKAAKKNMYKSIVIDVAALIGCALGMAATVLGTVFSAGIFSLVSMILSISMTGIWTGVDGYTLYQDYKNQNATLKDKLVMLLSTIALAAVSVVASVLAGTTVSLAITAAFTCSWLFYMLYMIYEWKSKSKEKDPHPSADSGFSSSASY